MQARGCAEPKAQLQVQVTRPDVTRRGRALRVGGPGAPGGRAGSGSRGREAEVGPRGRRLAKPRRPGARRPRPPVGWRTGALSTAGRAGGGWKLGLSAITLYLASASSPARRRRWSGSRGAERRREKPSQPRELRPPRPFRDPARQMSNERSFENVELGVIGKKKKVPRRVIHFVSGETMEEYSTDEDEVDGLEKKDVLPTVDPTKLTWGPYLWFYMLRAATSTLSVCDFLGEKIASVLGISTPKYQYAIDEYYRMKKEEEEEEEENRMSEEAERHYQQNKLQADSIVQTDQPETVVSSSFVNLNFEMEGECEVFTENKQNPVSVPP
ncbi:protein FAM177A1 [Myotis lucifugus]|nr:protein FAM177A1 [Myotis lucifugus]